MKERIGILVVNRLALKRRADRAGVLSNRTPAVEIPVDQIFQRYRGFDGIPWPELEHPEFLTKDGLAVIADWKLVDEYVRRIPRSEECDVVMLVRPGTGEEIGLKTGWTSAGFDLGYFDSEWSHFSIVLNEVLFGVQAELRVFANRLNEHLLLGTLGEASMLLTERARLLGTGADLEQSDRMEPIAVLLREGGSKGASI